MPPTFSQLYGTILDSNAAELQGIFLFSQRILKLRYLLAMLNGYCYEYVVPEVKKNAFQLAMSRGYCSNGKANPCLNAINLLANGLSPGCDFPGVDGVAKCATIGLANQLSVQQDSTGWWTFDGLPAPAGTPWPYVPGTQAAIIESWQSNMWYSCSPKEIVGDLVTQDCLFYKATAYQGGSSSKTYSWWNWHRLLAPGQSPSNPPIAPSSAPPPVLPRIVLSLSAHGDFGAGINEQCWWILRKSLAAGLLRKDAWAQALTTKDTAPTAHCLAAPIDEVERDSMKGFAPGLPGCSQWAVSEFTFLGDVVQAGFGSEIVGIVKAKKWC